MKICTIIPAAGKGKRFGGKKQFYNIKNKPVFLLTLEKFLPFSDYIFLVLPKEDIRKTEKFLSKVSSLKKFKEKIKLISGGKHRY
ncbi:MAG: 2-C-methyl-D-erythritol 4-phosphate cytidylyltransferase, partial [Endomicrobiia bacterium]